MATGRAGRAERLNERLRGAQRVNIEPDESFSLALPTAANPQSSPSRSINLSSLRKPTPKIGEPAKTRKSNNPPRSASPRKSLRRPTPTDRSPAPQEITTAKEGNDAYELLETSQESVPSPGNARAQDDTPTQPVSGTKRKRGAAPTKSPAPRLAAENLVEEEVEESPANAPGSGKRRRIQGTPSSARLQRMLSLEAQSSEPATSPLASYSRATKAKATDPASRRSTRGSTLVEATEAKAADQDRSTSKSPEQTQPDPIGKQKASLQARAEEERGSEEEAEEISENEAAKTLGRRPLRASSRGRPSPELGSSPQATKKDTPKSRVREKKRKLAPTSSVKQRQPVNKKAKADTSKPRIVKTRKPRKARTSDSAAEEGKRPAAARGPSINITVQKFVNLKPGNTMTEIPFANRAGESVVDVLAQVCEEVVANTLSQFAAHAEVTDDAKERKMCRIKMRAIEAYWGELSSRLLQHAIHLNHWHSLRKQVKQVQKERLALRGEILRLRAEREQVALQMDAVRSKHEEDSKSATQILETSALMQDVELAVEQGRDAPEPTGRDKRKAELGNLEVAISRISGQASSSSASGGLLQQLKHFNAFLERAAIALETK